jgi:hypothetical protein
MKNGEVPVGIGLPTIVREAVLILCNSLLPLQLTYIFEPLSQINPTGLGRPRMVEIRVGTGVE